MLFFFFVSNIKKVNNTVSINYKLNMIDINLENIYLLYNNIYSFFSYNIIYK